jgi:protoporphyrinogen oxidase
MSEHDLLILGAGLAGLSTASHYGAGATILEASPHIGGKARTRQRAGARFDITGHWLHLRDPGMLEWVPSLPGLTLKEHTRKARVFSHDVYTLYPFQANTHGLPPQVAKDCLLGLAEARLHDLESGRPVPDRPAPKTFAEWIVQKMGRGIAEHFMFPYNEKIWTVHPDQLSAVWCDRYIPVPKIEDVLAGAVGASREALGYNAHFLYPEVGGIQGLANAVASTVDGAIERRQPVLAVDLAGRRVRTADDRWHPYKKLVTTLPLPLFVDLCLEVAPIAEALADARGRLKWTEVAHLDVLAGGANHRTTGAWDGAGQPHWTYFPERRFPFYRVGSFSAVEPAMTDGDRRNFYVEFAHRGDLDVNAQVDASLVGLDAAGLIDGVDSVEQVWCENVKHAYVLNDEHHGGARDALIEWLKSQQVLSCGRYGNWEYSAMEDALIHGKKAARWAAGSD